jgi:hypothetical protein
VPGAIVSHSPTTSGRFIGSPSLALLANGDYVASHDLALASSSDLRDWQAKGPLLSHADTQAHARQYVERQFEGADIVFAGRTAFDDGLGDAQNAHNTNCLTFHRIQAARRLADG